MYFDPIRTFVSGTVMVLIMAFTIANESRAQSNAQQTVPIWQRWENTFTASTRPDEDVQLRIHFTAPGGKTYSVDGFWDGDNLWKVRFMPDEEGIWSYRAASTPKVEGLDGIEGRFTATVVENSANPLLRHGALRVSENKRYLAHADGTPFFWLGDTAWNGALLSSDEAWTTYLTDRDQKHFNVIQFVTTQWRAGPANAEGEVAYTGFEDITINPSFFQRMDRRIEEVNQFGMVAAPVLLWTLGEPEENPGKLPEDQAIKLARYLVARYGAHHVVWILAGDENFSGETGARWRRIGRAVFDDSHRAPVTLHPQGRQWFFDDFAQEDWLDLIIYQSSHAGDAKTIAWIHSGPPSQKWQQEPIRPIINSEPGYEDHMAHARGERHTAFDVRQQVYYSLLSSPPAGVTYGAHGIWSWETTPREPLNHGGTGVAKPWNEAMNLPGSEDMSHVAELFTPIDWWTLRPDQDVLVNPPGSEDPIKFVSAARSEDGDLAVVYIPAGGTLTLDRDRFKPDLHVEWFNPRNGSRQPAGTLNQSSFSTPDSEDWVLVIR